MSLAKRPLRISLLVALALLVAAPAHPAPKYMRTVQEYAVPDVTLVNQDGRKVKLPELLSSDKPVLVNFVYTTCATVSPVLCAGFSSLQKKLGADARSVRLVSLTIDPEHDTPQMLKDFLKRYDAQPGWDFLTGTRRDIDQVMKAFDAYIPNKQNHFPITFLKGPGRAKWVRLYGLVGPSDLVDEVRHLPK
jgi:protein SCO1/2